MACLFQAFLTALHVVAIARDESRSFYFILTWSNFCPIRSHCDVNILAKHVLDTLQYSAISEKDQKSINQADS